MKTLIDKLYDIQEDNNDEYHALLEKIISLETELMNRQECKDVFSEYQTADGDLHSLVCRREFRRGFLTGAHLVLEMMGRDVVNEKAK